MGSIDTIVSFTARSILGTVLCMTCFACRPASPNQETERPVVIVEEAVHSSFSDRDYEDKCAEIRRVLPEGFTVLVQKPFIVAGDEDPRVVQQRAEKTIQWAVTMLKKDYFSHDPDDIITIWLFKDQESYYAHARKIFNDEPTTPFGYYLESEKALLMNISTGGGTLVHEIVHPFVSANFPGCPPWFNEGLGSLYEQCGEKNGHIYAYTNWRLKGLQDALRAGTVPSFQELMSMNAYQFYTRDKGTNYGQARYLCYYLQEHGVLVTFYHEFHTNRLKDPTGYETLKRVLEIDDIQRFRQEWERFVLNLTFP